ncbi:uncharacterized protein L3040_000556 [Drepanopeziza brunnea f. sp. 'multigermtubi']|uniref:uncharacterized protein n=1 Tax=Drepanopeziza brunnea f. sp. 'multigermtubi' TaxID=698441 RepID=UPI002392612C|nr:hypothetical protein L3040_000556 [Drepanopeziza brunnea f. sp. 'multigermtubi']
MEKMIVTVQGLVTSDDEIVSTLHGLEALLLLGVFHINAGNPRRAWLTLWRAMSVGQLMGNHKSEPTLSGGRQMWFQITQADRYLALFLGHPAGSENSDYTAEETFENPNTDKDLLFTRKLCDLSTRIINRNEAVHTHAYAMTQEID